MGVHGIAFLHDRTGRSPARCDVPEVTPTGVHGTAFLRDRVGRSPARRDLLEVIPTGFTAPRFCTIASADLLLAARFPRSTTHGFRDTALRSAARNKPRLHGSAFRHARHHRYPLRRDHLHRLRSRTSGTGEQRRATRQADGDLNVDSNKTSNTSPGSPPAGGSAVSRVWQARTAADLVFRSRLSTRVTARSRDLQDVSEPTVRSDSSIPVTIGPRDTERAVSTDGAWRECRRMSRRRTDLSRLEPSDRSTPHEIAIGPSKVSRQPLSPIDFLTAVNILLANLARS